MTFTESIKTCYNKYGVFNGRASRSEYWWFYLYGLIVAFVLWVIVVLLTLQLGSDSPLPMLLYYAVSIFAVTIPGITVFVRRMHDIGKSGWWYWLALVPIVGIIVLIVFLVRESDGPNEYGDGPDEAVV